MTETIVITDPETDRYHTFGYISWWKQEVVRQATVLVVGAGALGNEVLKNLALMGIGRILIVDFDTIEDSNLSRSILFRHADNGRRKVDAAADAIKAINPDVQVMPWHGDINFEMGLGVFRHVDAVIGCLDNREARLSINRFCWNVGQTWVDGAIQELMGIVRVFRPGVGACYECTLTDVDYQIINLRYSCPLLARDNLLQGKVPTTPTSASIVAAFQTQEALKILHDMEVQPGYGLMINGLTNNIYLTEYPVKAQCMSHARYEPLEELPEARSDQITLADLLAHARRRLGAEAVLELGAEIVVSLTCNTCKTETPLFKRMARLYEQEALCPTCGERRDLNLTNRITGREDFLHRTLAEIDMPPLSIVRARQGEQRVYLELTGDQATFFQFR